MAVLNACFGFSGHLSDCDAGIALNEDLNGSSHLEG